jgi:hypothetical protein
MKRQEVVELRLELKRIIELNDESIKLQEEKFGRKDNMMIPYLTGFSDGYRVIYDRLAKY